MRFYQIEYTSCRIGRHAGFQICAATPGVHNAVCEADMDEILRLGLYRRPSNLLEGVQGDMQESGQEGGQAPMAFRAARLESGRQLVQFSRYLGHDDTGREGNFRTRSLVAEHPGENLTLWALDYYEWSGWIVPERETQKIATSGASSSTPADLPVAELEKPAGDSFSYPELTQFVREQSRRADWLCTLLATLFLPPAARRVVIRDEVVNNPYWLACLTKLLPKAVANSLSLSTFQPDGVGFDLLAAPAHIALPVSALVLTPEASEPLHRADTAPGVPESGRAYAQRVVDLLLHKPESVPDFLLELESMIRAAR